MGDRDSLGVLSTSVPDILTCKRHTYKTCEQDEQKHTGHQQVRTSGIFPYDANLPVLSEAPLIPICVTKL